MFIGHFALGLAAKPLAPSVSLGTLFIAAQFADLLWPLLVLAGVEVVTVAPGATAVTPLNFEYYPYSHSLLALLVWGALFGSAHVLLRRSTRPLAYTLGGLVVSHWVLDAISHRPDMPVMMTGPARVGLGLWNSLPATAAVELGLFAVGTWLYTRSTRPLNRWGSITWVALCAFLTIVYVASLFGPPPPSATVVALVGLSTWLLIGWAYAVDRSRTPKAPAGHL